MRTRGRGLAVAGAVMALAVTMVSLPAAGAPAGNGPGVAGPESVPGVTVRDRRLSVAVTATPLASVLQAVARQAGFTLRLDGDLSAPVTRTFTDVPLADGIRRLARGQSLGFVYAPSPTTGALVISELWVIASAPPPRPLGAAERADRLRTVNLLALRPGDAALTELTTILQRDGDATVRTAAAAALGRRRDPRAAAALRAALRDDNPLVRSTASRSLAMLEAASRR